MHLQFSVDYIVDSKNPDKADGRIDSVNAKLKTKLKTNLEEASKFREVLVFNLSDKDNVRTSSEPPSEYKTAAEEPCLTSDKSITVSPDKSKNSLSLVNKCQNFITVRKKSRALEAPEQKKMSECPTTPVNQNIESQVKAMLDSIYGKSWRANQQKVLLPMSERKVKCSDNKPTAAPMTER